MNETTPTPPDLRAPPLAAEKAPGPEATPIWGRVMALMVLAAGASLWCERHLGVSPFEDPVGLLGLSGLVTAASIVLDASLSEAERETLSETVRGRVRGWIRRMLSTPVLALLYFVAIGAAAMFSSVTLVPPPEGETKVVTVTGIADGAKTERDLVPGGDVVQILLPTNPLGRALTIDVPGFHERQVTLFPPLGLTIDVANDLQPLPTLIFRPDYTPMVAYAEGGSFLLYDRSCNLIGEARAGARRESFLVGAPRSIPDAVKSVWTLELRARTADLSDLSKTLLAWQSPRIVEDAPALKTGESVYAVLTSGVGKPTAAARVRVGEAPFQSVEMIQLTEGPHDCEDAP